MNARMWQTLAVVSVSVSLVGCPKKDGSGTTDAAPSAEPVASTVVDAAPPPEGANDADIKHYPDETKIDHVPADVQWYVATVRQEASSTGAVVAVLKKGTTTTKLAQKGDFYLVSFTEPSPPSRKLVGWLDGKSYTPQIWDAGKHFITCVKPQVAVLLDTGELCVTPCTADNDTCPVNQACNAVAPLSDKGTAGSDVVFCGPGKKKASTPTSTDAGAPATADAGAPTTADAGATKDAAAPAVNKAAFVHAADAGSCPQNFIQAGKFCRFVCNTSDDCPNKAACKLFNGTSKACADGL